MFEEFVETAADRIVSPVVEVIVSMSPVGSSFIVHMFEDQLFGGQFSFSLVVIDLSDQFSPQRTEVTRINLDRAFCSPLLDTINQKRRHFFNDGLPDDDVLFCNGPSLRPL